MKPLLIILMIVICVTNGDPNKPLRILSLFPFQGSSHFLMFKRLLLGLRDRGHEIDVVGHFPRENPLERYNDISVKGVLPELTNNVSLNRIENSYSISFILEIFKSAGTDMCKKLLQTSTLDELKRSNKTYDLIITEIFAGDCMVGFAYLFKAPVVAVTTSVMLPWANDIFGNPEYLSYIPNYAARTVGEMTFWQRSTNVLIAYIFKFIYHFYSVKPCTQIARNFFGPDLPPLDQLTKNISLLLVNSHLSINIPRPFNPNVIEVGGLHITPPKRLEPEIEKFMNESQHGVIYFSMGSMVKSETFHEHKLRAFYDAFEEMPYDVVWKAEEKEMLRPIPKKIKFITWAPQIGILCHPKTKLFITHGGAMSTQEAIYCGVPMIGIPFFGDQDLNMASYEQKGVAKMITYPEITKDSILRLLRILLGNRSYPANAKRLAHLFRDRPVPPLDLALYWVEYVARYAGARHLRPLSADMSYIKLHLIDVIAFAVVTLAVLFYILYILVDVCYAQVLYRATKRFKKQKVN